MKKITQILFTLLLSLVATNAFAAVATEDIQASTSVSSPEHKFYILNQSFSKYWGTTSQPVDEASASLYAFFKVGSTDFYNIYNVTTGKWAVYDDNIKASYSTSTDKGRDKISWVSTRPTTDHYAGYFKFNKGNAYATSTSCYAIEIATTSGTAASWYLNWYQGLSKTHNSVGFYNKSAMGSSSSTTDAASAWVLKEYSPTANITYQVLGEGEEVVWSQTIKANIGEPYPTPTHTNPFIAFTGVPEGNVTVDETITVNYAYKYECFADVASVTQWYALDIHGNEGDYPVYAANDDTKDYVGTYSNTAAEYQYRRVAKGTADDYQGGSVMNDKYAWAFIGNPFDGVKLYNKGLKQYVYFNGVPSECTGDRTKAPATFVDDATSASIFSVKKTTATSQDLTNAFCFQNEKIENDYNILNQKNYVISGYKNDFGSGSAFRAWAINYTTGTVNRTLAAEYGTIIVPFYAAIPDGITVYSCNSVGGDKGITLQLVEQTAIYPNVPYIIKGTSDTEYTFTCPTTGSYTDPATKGLLTGVYETTDLQTIAQGAGEGNTAYVLALQNSRVAFCSLEDKAYTETLPANYCYLTLKNEAGGEVKGTLYFDEETGIESIHNFEQAKPLNNSSEFIIHNDGKFLENGKIVIVKNNAKYNVAGQMIK